MSALMGPYEASLVEHYSGVRKRLLAPSLMPIQPPVPRVRLLSPFSPERNPLPPIPEPAIDLLTPPSWKVLLALVAAKHGLKPSDLTGPDRARPYVEARYDAIALIYTHMDVSLPVLGKKFGGRDHSSILHGLRRRGIPARYSGPFWTPEKDAQVDRLWCRGWTLKQIAEALPPRSTGETATIAMVSQRIIRLGLPQKDGRPRQSRDQLRRLGKARDLAAYHAVVRELVGKTGEQRE